MNSIKKDHLSINSIWKDKETRWYLIITTVASIYLFSWFKSLYPFPNFAIESPNYFDRHSVLAPGIPLSEGYLLILEYLGPITHSSTLLVIFQYAFIQISILYLLYTFYFLFNSYVWAYRISLFLLIVNTLFLNIGNLITADAFLISASLILFAQILWFLKCPTLNKIIVITIIYTVCFILDKTASWYLLIIIVSIIISGLKNRNKFLAFTISIILPIFLLGGAQLFGAKKLKINTPISNGWQIASNALFAYQYTQSLSINSIPPDFKSIHTISNKHKDSLKTLWLRPDTLLGYYYLTDKNSPLITYIKNLDEKNKNVFNENLEKLYAGYGKFLIKKNIVAYFHHYITPNLIYYYSPLPESLTWYNKGYDTITNPIKNWFHFNSNKLKSWNDSASIPLMRKQTPIVLAIIKALFIILIICYYFLNDKLNHDVLLKKAVYILGFTCLIHFIYSVLRAPITIRSQAFIIPIYLISATLLVNWIFKMAYSSATYLRNNNSVESI